MSAQPLLVKETVKLPQLPSLADLQDLRVAVVHEWLTTYAGSEKVLEQILEMFPAADIFSLVDHLPAHERRFLNGRPVRTSFMQKLPWSARVFRGLLWLMPSAIESLDLSRYNIVISSSHAVAKGVLTGRRHIRLRLARLEAEDIEMVDPEFRGVLDDAQLLLLRNEANQSFSDGGLAGICAAAKVYIANPGASVRTRRLSSSAPPSLMRDC